MKNLSARQSTSNKQGSAVLGSGKPTPPESKTWDLVERREFIMEGFLIDKWRNK